MTLTLRHGRRELIPALEPLWNALFEHHLSVGAAGLPTIPRSESWPLRRAHYERLAAEPSGVSIWLAGDVDSPAGYALAYEDYVSGAAAQVLETLSVLPSARGTGLGTRLMDAVDAEARSRGIRVGAVDVLGGNERARGLYLRRGYLPHSESWMRCRISERREDSPEPVDLSATRARAEALGFGLEFSPGPDDTWVTPAEIAELIPAPAGISSLTAGLRLEKDTAEALIGLFSTLERTGRWAIRCEIPAASDAIELRRFLAAEGFRVSTERLLRLV